MFSSIKAVVFVCVFAPENRLFQNAAVSIAECSAFYSETMFYNDFQEDDGALPQVRETRMEALSSACGRRARYANA